MTNDMYERTLKKMLAAELYGELQDTIVGFQFVDFSDLDKISFHEYYEPAENDKVVGFTAIADLLDVVGQISGYKRFENVVCIGYIYEGCLFLKTVACNNKLHRMTAACFGEKVDLR